MSSGKTADALIAGDVFETLEFKVSEEMNESYLQAEEDFSDDAQGYEEYTDFCKVTNPHFHLRNHFQTVHFISPVRMMRHRPCLAVVDP